MGRDLRYIQDALATEDTVNNQEVRYPGFRKLTELGVITASAVAYGARLLPTAFDRSVNVDDDVPKNTRRLTVLVPGLLAPRGSMAPLEASLRRHGFTVRTVAHGWRSVRSLTDARGEFKRRVRDLRSGLRRLEAVDLVCHDLGGIVAYDVLEEGFLRELNVKLVTLGAPFRGTSAAYFLGPLFGAAAAITPKNRNGVRHLPPPPLDRTTFLSLAGSRDLVVLPHSSWHGLGRNETIDVDHLGLLRDERVHWRIAEFLRP